REKTRLPSTHAYKSEDVAQGFLAGVLAHGIGVRNEIPARRTPCWLRALKRLRKRGEPRPLRLGPLHMDVHGDNIVRTA
ncbi:hypothetical protein NLN78_23615, partial [Citrobacter portucalensis]|nr:hypothetical protein [Citrobacter portucalensis]